MDNQENNQNVQINEISSGVEIKDGEFTEKKVNEIKKEKKKNPFYKTTAFILSASLSLSLLGGYGGASIALKQQNSTNTPTLQQSNLTHTNNSASAETLSVSDVANEALKSVVEIRTESVTSDQYIQQYTSSGAGSGVILSQDGYIATNYHVIDGANTITVRDYDGNEYKATLVGSDEKTDLAVLKIEATGLSPVTFGDSSSLKVGDTAIAIGNPLGELGGTVTTGIISALDREIQINNETMTLLQTNAAINPGNSGGGLFNANGELIGIVNAKSTGEAVEGLGFAIPSNIAKTIIEDLMSDGYVSNRPYLGVSLQDQTNQYGFNKSSTSVYIASVVANSAASKAGLTSGDQIVSVDGQEVSFASEVKTIINQHSANDTIEITIIRNNQQKTVQVTLGEQTPNTQNS
ncbi:MAG: trypsin-like peptidase domain-containing protein [Erysipelotrichaceae bacterium]|nr:trypsin-like peptidase domain-containing protein [Erysipelotrichaceae bacterium]